MEDASAGPMMSPRSASYELLLIDTCPRSAHTVGSTPATGPGKANMVVLLGATIVVCMAFAVGWGLCRVAALADRGADLARDR